MPTKKSKLATTARGLALSLCFALCVGCGGKSPGGAAEPQTMTPERIKDMVAILDAPQPGFGLDARPRVATMLGDLGQSAKDAGAVPALTRLSKSAKAPPEAKAAAAAALAKLNAAP